MDIAVTIKLDKAAQKAIDKIVEAIEKTACGGCGSEDNAAAELLEEMRTERFYGGPKALKVSADQQKEPKPDFKETAAAIVETAEKIENTPEPENDLDFEAVRAAIVNYTGGNAEKRAAVKDLLTKFSDSGKLADVDPSKFVDFVAALGELDG
jgi:hypothetical protein